MYACLCAQLIAKGFGNPGDLYYVYNTLYLCRAVTVPLHSVYRACTFYPLFTRAVRTLLRSRPGQCTFYPFCTRAVLWLYHCTAFCTSAVQQSARVMYVSPVLYSCRAVAVPLHRVLYSRRATVARVMYVLPVLYSYRAVAVPLDRVCTRAVQQSARVMYVLPVLYSCRAVAVPLHRVLYSRRATVARVMYVLPVLYLCRAVAVPLYRVWYSRRATYIYIYIYKFSLTGIRTHVPTCPEGNMLPLSYSGEGLYFIFLFLSLKANKQISVVTCYFQNKVIK